MDRNLADVITTDLALHRISGKLQAIQKCNMERFFYPTTHIWFWLCVAQFIQKGQNWSLP